MTEALPTMTVRVDYPLNSSQMAHALLNHIFVQDGLPHILSATQTIEVVQSFTRQEAQRFIREQVMTFGADATHWQTQRDAAWDATEVHEVHVAAMVHIEQVFPGMIQWQTERTHPASGLTLELFPLDAPRWARVTTEHRDGTREQHTRTSNVDSAHRLFGKLYTEYLHANTDDEN